MKIKIIPVLLMITLLLSGCNSYLEVSNRNFVQIIGIDKTRDGFSLTMKLFEGKSDGADNQGKTKEVKNITPEGKTFTDAVTKASIKEGKKIFLGHCNMIAVGNSVEDVYKDLDCLLTGNTVPLSAKIVMCDNPSDFVNAENSSVSVDILKRKVESGEASESNLFSLFESKNTSGGFIIPIAEVKDKAIGFSGGQLIKNGKKSERADDETMTGLSLINNSVKNIMISVQKDNKTAGVMLGTIKMKVKTTPEADGIFAEYMLETEGKVTDNPDLMTINEIEKATEKYLSDKITPALYDVSKAGTDVINIKKILKIQQPEFYNAHKDEQIFELLRFSVKTTCTLDEQLKL